MSKARTSLCFCAVLPWLVATTALADENPPPPDAGLKQLMQRIDNQQAQIEAMRTRLNEVEADNARLRADQDGTWLTEQREVQLRQLINEVISDADARTSMLDDNMTAGWDGNFFLKSSDNSFLLKVSGQMQSRFMLSTSDNAYDGATSSDLDNTRHGFEMTRIRLMYTGHVIDPTWRYGVLHGFNQNGDGLLLDAWVDKDLGDGWALRFGQFKTPLLHEFLVSTKKQLFVERSHMAQALSGRYTQGVMLTKKTDELNLSLALSDGLNAANSSYSSEGVEGVAVTSRVEWLAVGDSWKPYSDLTGWPDEKPMVVIGGAGHFQQGEYGTGGTTLSTGDEATTYRWAVDTTIENDGTTFLVAFVGDHVRDADLVEDRDAYELLVQAGVFVTEDFELIGRYEWGNLDVDGVEDLSILTVGFNKYISGHALKWTTDVGYSFNALNRVKVNGNTFGYPIEFQGWRPDASDSDGQIVLRSQLQLLF